ncbi:hypothetical protein F2Q70_00001308 [Brassica cretica]|uniref:Pentacotripeptide-repeat region of PRORP domain-containing protein n=1 Tax=Brassica cretica TaxID=69181 RepID=A0A8S9J1V8_BRACR|nr:hypothetical protein F2Q70_00001308 [Brassica cretica]
MIQRSIAPDIFTYNSLIYGFCMHDRIDEAKEMFDLIITEDCYPDVVTYNTLINGFCKSKRVEDGMELFREMSQRGLFGGTVTYTTLIQGFFQARKQMVSCGVPPNIWTYNILLDGFCDNGKLEKALVIFNDMQNSGMELGIITYNIIIGGMCRAGKVEDARELFCSLSLNGVKPDVRTYTIMISGFGVKRFKQEAVALFRKMKEDRPLPDDCTYNALIRAHLWDGDKAASAELIKEMTSFGFSAEASSTFGLVTNMLHDGRLDKSFLDIFLTTERRIARLINLTASILVSNISVAAMKSTC